MRLPARTLVTSMLALTFVAGSLAARPDDAGAAAPKARPAAAHAAHAAKKPVPKKPAAPRAVSAKSGAKAAPAAAAATKPKPAAVTAKPATGEPVVVLKTSKGEIKVKLHPDKAPVTVANFLKYVDAKFYDGTIFHRVISTFMIQGGGFNPDMTQKPTNPPITLESQNGLKNTRGAIAMARTGDPNSATAQFFVDVVDNANLDYPSFDGHGYAVFGEVVSGMDVVDAIKAVPTGQKNGMGDVPTTPVIIESIRRQ